MRTQQAAHQGVLSWSVDAGAPLVPETATVDQPSVVALAAADGVLVVPAGSSLIGYAHAAGH
jgi:hypothetical protein